MIMLDKYTSRIAYWRFRAITNWLTGIFSVWVYDKLILVSGQHCLKIILSHQSRYLNDTNFTHIQIHSAWAIRHLKIEFWKINESTILSWYFLLTKFHHLERFQLLGRHSNVICIGIKLYPWGHFNQWASVHLWTFTSNLFSIPVTQ